jgi:hypothetical protein
VKTRARRHRFVFPAPVFNPLSVLPFGGRWCWAAIPRHINRARFPFDIELRSCECCGGSAFIPMLSGVGNSSPADAFVPA